MADYSGLLGAYRFAARESESLLFRSYVVVSGLLGAYVGLLLALSLVSWLARPTGLIGEHALLGVVGILVIAPLFAPVLIAARRHRRAAPRPRDDLLLGLAGYGFVVGLALGLFITDPNDHAVTGPLRAVDALPRSYGLAPPVVTAALLGLAVRLTRPAAE